MSTEENCVQIVLLFWLNTWRLISLFLCCILKEKRLLSLPFCMLTVQGSSKVFLASGQSARVFQVLPKAAEVPSITPLVVLKSSVCMSLKFPQRPGRKQMVCASLLQDDRYW